MWFEVSLNHRLTAWFIYLDALDSFCLTFPDPLSLVLQHTSVSPDSKTIVVVGDNSDGLLTDSQNGKVVILYQHVLLCQFSISWRCNSNLTANLLVLLFFHYRSLESWRATRTTHLHQHGTLVVWSLQLVTRIWPAAYGTPGIWGLPLQFWRDALGQSAQYDLLLMDDSWWWLNLLTLSTCLTPSRTMHSLRKLIYLVRWQEFPSALIQKLLLWAYQTAIMGAWLSSTGVMLTLIWTVFFRFSLSRCRSVSAVFVSVSVGSALVVSIAWPSAFQL